MMKKLLLAALAFSGAAALRAQPAEWLKRIAYHGEEDVHVLEYIPGNSTVSPAVWTFTEGAIPPGAGGGSPSYEHRLAAYNTQTGNPLFQYPVQATMVYNVRYDASLDQVLVLVGASGNSLMPSLIGPDTLLNNAVPGCANFGLLRYNRTGVLQGKQWLSFPCSHDISYPIFSIDTQRNRIAASMPVFGSMFLDSTAFTFGSQTALLRKDSSYISLFEWNYTGNPLRMSLFIQPFSSPDRSIVRDITYGDRGDVYLMGYLRHDIQFGSIPVSAGTGFSTFMARVRHDGAVADARKIYSSPQEEFPGNLAYSPVNKHVYFGHSWTGQLFLDGVLLHNGAPAFMSNAFVAEIDSNLNILHTASFRFADTTVTAGGGRLALNRIGVGDNGRVMAIGTMRDSIRVGTRSYRSHGPNDEVNTFLIGLDKNLKPDSVFLSEGPGSEIGQLLSCGLADETYIAGRFNQSAVFPPHAVNVQTGVMDVFVARLKLGRKAITGIKGIQGGGGQGLVVYPSPATDQLFVNLEQMTSVAVFSVDGRLLYSRKLSGTGAEHRIDLSGFAPGWYLVRAEDRSGAVYATRFPKQ